MDTYPRSSPFLQVCESVVPVELQESVLECLKTLVERSLSGEQKLVGKTLLDPKKDSKWERGRARRVLHFGAHLRGGRAVGIEVEDIPESLLKLSSLLAKVNCIPQSEGSDVVEAVTVDFFRRGSYTPSLPLPGPLGRPADQGDRSKGRARIAIEDSTTKGSAVYSTENRQAWENATDLQQSGDRENKDSKGGKRGGHHDRQRDGGEKKIGLEGPDTEPAVCLVWLQGEADMVVSSVDDIAAAEGGKQLEGGKEEGRFGGLTRFSATPGTALVWDSVANLGLQMAIPRSDHDRVLVSFQRITPIATKRLQDKARARAEARERQAERKRAEAAAAEAKAPIPAMPVEKVWPEFEAVGRSGTSESANGVGHGEHTRTPAIEREHVQAVYDTIASHWSHTRYKPWPKVEEFISNLPAPALVADIGCGNGKYLGCGGSGRLLIGSDASVRLLDVCIERVPQASMFCAADCMNLPYRSGVFDAAISIAVMHHFSTEGRRIRALQELERVLCVGGQVLIYAWAMEQDGDSRRSFAHQDVLVPWHFGDQHTKLQDTGHTQVERIPEPQSQEATDTMAYDMFEDKISGSSLGGHDERNRSPLRSSPVPTHGVRVEGPGRGGKGGSVVYQRYCHVYTEGELELLVRNSCVGLQVVKSYYDRSNWCVVAKKVS
ncbi:unnamed protein product [Discosporangium mesarthrocarpum]